MKNFLPFFKDFGNWETRLWTLAILAKKYGQGHQNCFPRVVWKNLGTKLLFQTFLVFFSFPQIWGNRDFEVIKILGHGCRTAFLSSRETFSRLFDFFENYVFFWSVWHSQWKNDRSLAKSFRWGCQKCNSRVQQTLWGKLILQRVVQFGHFIELWTKKEIDFGRKLNKTSVETAFSVSRGTFGQKQFFWRFYVLYDKFCTLSKKKWDFSRKIAAEVSKLLCLCPGTNWREIYLPKNVHFFQFFRPLSTR